VEDKIQAYEQSIQQLEEQLQRLKAEVAELRKAQAQANARTGQPLGTERAQVFGFLQFQFENTRTQERSRFLIRRARVGVHGTLDRGFRYEIHTNLDDARGPLRNAWIDYTAPRGGADRPTFRVGQFKLPYSLEALVDSGATTPFIERALAVDLLSFNHDRDIGVGVYSQATPRNGNDAPERPFLYFLSLTNGAGRNQFVATANKLFAGRIQFNTVKGHPFLGGRLAVGFNTRLGRVQNLNLPAGQQREDERYGFDLEFVTPQWRLRGEYLWGRNQAKRPEGFYALLGYRPSKTLELLARYEGYSPDALEPSAHRTTVGLTYFWSKSAQMLINYEFLSGRSPIEEASGLRLRVQALFP
jgi:hypothetical protein